MRVNDIIDKLNATVVNVCDGCREVSTGYVGDFLSFVMGRAPQDCVWFTVMANVNVAAVAKLADVAVVVICENVTPDSTLVERATQQGINLIRVELDAFNAIRALFQC